MRYVVLLQLNNIEVKYMGVILVLRGVTLQIEKGGVVDLLGSNGVGKSTTLKSISGLLKAAEGKVTTAASSLRDRGSGTEIPGRSPGRGSSKGSAG